MADDGGKRSEGRGDKRTYSSPLREQQQERTREIIVEAICAQVLESGVSDFSVQDIARRANVSLRTVYRYFPAREDLLAAVDDAWTKKQPRPLPEHPSELPALIADIFNYFEANKALLEAATVTSLGRQVHGRSRARRLAAMKDMLAKHTPHLDSATQMQRLAAIRVLSGSDSWRTMTRDFGMSTEDAIKSVQWALQLLLDDTLTKKKGERR
jgi:AcrR family transcriptional regulator